MILTLHLIVTLYFIRLYNCKPTEYPIIRKLFESDYRIFQQKYIHSFNWTNNSKAFVVDVIITTYVLKRYAIVFSTKQYM